MCWLQSPAWHCPWVFDLIPFNYWLKQNFPKRSCSPLGLIQTFKKKILEQKIILRKSWENVKLDEYGNKNWTWTVACLLTPVVITGSILEEKKSLLKEGKKEEQNIFYTTVDKSGLRSCFNSRLFHSQNHTSAFIIQVTPWEYFHYICLSDKHILSELQTLKIIEGRAVLCNVILSNPITSMSNTTLHLHRTFHLEIVTLFININ